jgi:hypothetical protein
MKTPTNKDFYRPWAIVRLLPNAQRYTVAKFFNRRDAHDHLRVLNRFMPAAEFEVVFETPESEPDDDQHELDPTLQEFPNGRNYQR